MSTEPSPQTPEKSDEDRLMQIAEDIHALHRQILRIQQWLRYAQEMLETMDISPP